jgi:multiple sugar transport system permease protein
MTTTLTPQLPAARAHRWSIARLRHAPNWIFLVPTLIFFIGYQAIPILRVFWLSFTDFRYLSQEPAQWIWFQNYIEALNDPLVLKGIWRAVQFTILFLPGVIFIPLILAIMVDRVENQRLATLYRVVLLIPAVIPSALIFILWKWMYDFQIGPINYVLIEILKIFTPQSAPQWLGGTDLTIPAIVIMEIWWGLGFHTMFFLAGLATIPKDLTDAARIDGANEWQLFWNITLPRLQPIMAILAVLRFGTAMAVIDEYLILGGFDRAAPTYTWTVYMYDLSFKTGEWAQGRAAAIGWLGAILMMIFVAGLLYVFRPNDE